MKSGKKILTSGSLFSFLDATKISSFENVLLKYEIKLKIRICGTFSLIFRISKHFKFLYVQIKDQIKNYIHILNYLI